ncbi:unnamed protein product [Symbiodinium sp. KB8]|nr:unnamed protein product [Symbiodinium sp. KB8]
MTVAAARVASKVPTTRATYNPTAMSRLLASAAVAPEHDVYGLNVDLTGWSPSFALVPQLRRMKCVNDLIASEVSNKVIFTLLRVRAIIFEDSVHLGSGVSVNGFPMGWLPSLDSLMHGSWLDACWADVQLEAEKEIERTMRITKQPERSCEAAAEGEDLWAWLALEAAFTRACQIDDATLQVEFNGSTRLSVDNTDKDFLFWRDSTHASRRGLEEDDDDAEAAAFERLGNRKWESFKLFMADAAHCASPPPHFEDAVLPPNRLDVDYEEASNMEEDSEEVNNVEDVAVGEMVDSGTLLGDHMASGDAEVVVPEALVGGGMASGDAEVVVPEALVGGGMASDGAAAEYDGEGPMASGGAVGGPRASGGAAGGGDTDDAEGDA